jgi:hypothetical protein
LNSFVVTCRVGYFSQSNVLADFSASKKRPSRQQKGREETAAPTSRHYQYLPGKRTPEKAAT